MDMGNTVGMAHSGCLLNQLGFEEGCSPFMAMYRIRFPVRTMFNETYTATCREARLGVDNDLRRLVEAFVQGIMDGVFMLVGLFQSPIKRHDEMEIDPHDRTAAPGS